MVTKSGPLLHFEDLKVEGQHYSLAVFRADAGVLGRWTCRSCQTDYELDQAQPSIDLALRDVKAAIRSHHKNVHGGSASLI